MPIFSSELLCLVIIKHCSLYKSQYCMVGTTSHDSHIHSCHLLITSVPRTSLKLHDLLCQVSLNWHIDTTWTHFDCCVLYIQPNISLGLACVHYLDRTEIKQYDLRDLLWKLLWLNQKNLNCSLMITPDNRGEGGYPKRLQKW